MQVNIKYLLSTFLTEYCQKVSIHGGFAKLAWELRFSFKSVRYIIRTYGLRSRHTRLREKGYLSLPEKMVELNSTQKQIMRMRDEDKIVFHRATEKNEYLYEPQNMNKYLVKTQS